MEVDLLKNYPKTKRDTVLRGALKTEKQREIARQFGPDFFDGDRAFGYGGFKYNPKYWKPVIPDFQLRYDIERWDRVLDVGCAKGFMLYDMVEMIPGITAVGIDISKYAIENGVKHPNIILTEGNALKLPFPDKYFDVTFSINTIHNLDTNGVVQALREITRVSRKGSFITVDAYRDDEEKKRMEDWNLTAKTILHVDEWKRLFKEVGYYGDYYWFTP